MCVYGIVAAVAITAAVGPAAGAGAPNPEFASWARFRPGTSVTMKVTASGGLTLDATITTTLIEVGADKLVTEHAFAGTMLGVAGRAEPARRDVPRAVARAGGKGDDAGRRPEGTFEEGAETLTISGTEVKTTWFKFKSEADGKRTEGTVWVSDDLPLRVVKQTLTTTVGAVRSTQTAELTGFKKP